MAPRPRRKLPVWRVVAPTILGMSIVAFVLGYTLGAATYANRFSMDQAQFIHGLVQGSKFRVEYEEWKGNPDRDPEDPAQEPETRCAGDFFPERPMAMAGCVQGLSDPPADGYKLPTRRG